MAATNATLRFGTHIQLLSTGSGTLEGTSASHQVPSSSASSKKEMQHKQILIPMKLLIRTMYGTLTMMTLLLSHLGMHLKQLSSQRMQQLTTA
jgi:hypothetical protein